MRTFIFFLLAFSVFNTQGQVDKVFLRNGSLIRGELKGTEITDTLTIAVDSLGIMIPLGLVAEIDLSRKSDFDLTGFPGQKYRKGWSAGFTGGVTMGRSGADAVIQTFPSFSISQFYHFHPLVNLGLTGGFLNFEDFHTYPIGVEYNLVPDKISQNLLFYTVIGKSFAKSNQNNPAIKETEGGLFLQAGIGWQHPLGKHTLQYRLGYLLQDVDQTIELWQNYFVTNSRQLNRITLQIQYRLNYYNY
ncbi:MAG: hypothetical protein ACJA2C_001114 [Marinoscillum sp.]